MKQNDFEKWIRDRVDDLDFPATEDGWEKMHQSIKEKKRQKIIVPVISKPLLRIAGAVAGIAGLAVFVLTLQQKNDSKNIPDRGTAAIVTSNDTAVPDTGSSMAPIPANGLYLAQSQYRTAYYPPQNITVHGDSTGKLALQDSAPAIQAAPGPEHGADHLSGNKRVEKEQHHPQQVFPAETYHAARNQQNTRYLVDAHIGNQAIGGIQYQVALTSRIPINSKIFLDGSLTLSSNAINYREDHTINGITVTPGFNSSGDQVLNITETRARARYANTIYALGLAPMIGTHLNKRLDIAAGAYVIRNLNTALPLQEGAELSSADMAEAGIIEAQYKVNEWDYGLKTTIDYKLYEQVGIQIGYRMGLSDYLKADNKQFTNSGIIVGLKYYIK